MVFLTIPIMHYICLRQGWPNDHLAYSIYGLAIISFVFIALVLCLFSNITFKWGIYEWIFTVLIVLELFSVMNSVDINMSIWGTPGRNEGILMLLSYYTFFYLARFLKSDRSKYILVNIFLGIGVIHCLYGLCQYFDIGEASGWVIDSYHAQKMISGVTGQFDFMASYTVMLSGLAAAMFYYSDKVWKKLLFLCLLGLYLITLVLAKAMSGYLGVAFMIVAFLLYIFITRNKHVQFEKNKFVSIGIVAALFLIVIAMVSIINKKMDNFIYNELSSVFNQLSELIKTRQISDEFGTWRGWAWKQCVRLIPQYWLTGVGVDSLVYPFMYIFGQSPIGEIFDKAHNEYLQVAVTMGIPALITYLTFYFFVFKDNLQRLVEIVHHDRNWNGEPLYFGLMLVVIGYLSQAFFNISVIDVAPFFWILLGLMSESMIEVQKRFEVISNQKRYIKMHNGQIVEIKGVIKKNY